MKLPNGWDAEVVLLLAGMVMIFGGTLIMNFIVHLIFPGLGQ
tara:strand:- start:554 stop:679 length:126 start_codon:yes stop_codon:yes gene_type:complete